MFPFRLAKECAMDSRKQSRCPDCAPMVDRRDFMKTVGSAALVGAAGPALLSGRFALAAPTTKSAAETAVGRFYATLSDAQKQTIVFPFENELRSKISANWHITKPQLKDDFYSNEQRALVNEIIR